MIPSSPDANYRFIFPPFDPAEVFVMVFSVRASSTVYVGLAEEKGVYHRRMYVIGENFVLSSLFVPAASNCLVKFHVIKSHQIQAET